MKQLIQKIIATFGTLSFILFPQSAIGAEEEAASNKESEAGAAGEAAAGAAVGGVSAGTIAAIVAIEVYHPIYTYSLQSGLQ